MLALSGQERGRKREMMQCYASQSDVLVRFESECERYRRAPQVTFDCRLMTVSSITRAARLAPLGGRLAPIG